MPYDPYRRGVLHSDPGQPWSLLELVLGNDKDVKAVLGHRFQKAVEVIPEEDGGGIEVAFPERLEYLVVEADHVAVQPDRAAQLAVPENVFVFFMIKFKEATIEQNIIDCIRETK